MALIETTLSERTMMYWRMAQILRNPASIERNKVVAAMTLDKMKEMDLPPKLKNRVVEVSAMARKLSKGAA